MKDTTRDQYDTIQQSSSQSSYSGLLYFLIGGGIGATLGLLFAPKAGVELRTDISDLTRKGYDETVDLAHQIKAQSVDLAHQIKEQSAEVYSSLKEKTGKVYDLAATKLNNTMNSELPGEMLEGQNAPLQKKQASRKQPEIH